MSDKGWIWWHRELFMCLTINLIVKTDHIGLFFRKGRKNQRPNQTVPNSNSMVMCFDHTLWVHTAFATSYCSPTSGRQLASHYYFHIGLDARYLFAVWIRNCFHEYPFYGKSFMPPVSKALCPFCPVLSVDWIGNSATGWWTIFDKPLGKLGPRQPLLRLQFYPNNPILL